ASLWRSASSTDAPRAEAICLAKRRALRFKESLRRLPQIASTLTSKAKPPARLLEYRRTLGGRQAFAIRFKSRGTTSGMNQLRGKIRAIQGVDDDAGSEQQGSGEPAADGCRDRGAGAGVLRSF